MAEKRKDKEKNENRAKVRNSQAERRRAIKEQNADRNFNFEGGVV